MLKRKLGLAVAAILCVGLMTSCININDNRGNGGDSNIINGIDYTDYLSGEYSIKVKNDSKKNIVCFMNTPRESNLISGVRAGTLVGLKKNSLFTNTKDFILFVVTEDDYLANKNDLAKLDRTPFATVYAYYNAESAEIQANKVYTISNLMGGEYHIIINNNEKYNVELRQNGLYGESLAFAGAYTTQTKINMVEGEYDIFPVFRKYSSRAQEIVTTFPKYTKNGVEYPVFFHFGLDPENDEKEFTTSDWFNGALYDASETPSAAYIAIHNGNSGTGVSLYKGALETAAITSTGGKTINTGKTLTFEVPMTSLGNNRYSTTATVSGWKIGTSMNKVSIDTLEVKAGKMYYIELSGSNYLDLEAKWKTVEGSSEILAEDTGFEDEESTIFK